MTWTLLYNKQKKPIAEWGLYGLTRHTLNQGIDKVQFWQGIDSLKESALFQAEASIEIFYKESRWFYGILTKTPTFGQVGKEEKAYEAAGPWWFLEHLVYQQKWHYADQLNQEQLYTEEKSRCVLGQGNDGNPITAATTIRDILTYAREQGAPFQIGSIEGLDFTFPFDEIKDISCAEAIQRILRWAPDSILWFDYKASPYPELHLSRKETMQERTLSIESLEHLQILPRHDLQVKAVVLKYEHTHSKGEETWKTLTIDRYPLEATGREFKALVLTIELEGGYTHLQRQRVKTEAIQADGLDWWRKHLPALDSLNPQNLKIENVQRESNLPNELLEGAIAQWMKKQVQTEVIRANISYQSDTENVYKRAVALRIRATDAQSKTYERATSQLASTPPPLGLAKTFYQAISSLQYEGKLSWRQEEVEAPLLGKVLNLKGGLKEWENMCAIVQSVKENVDTGTVHVRIGPAKHLGPDDLIQLMRSNRLRQAPPNAPIRCNLNASGAKPVTEFPEHSPMHNVFMGGGQFEKLVFKGQNTELILDTNAIQKAKTVKLREYKIVDSGTLKTALLLSSEGY